MPVWRCRSVRFPGSGWLCSVLCLWVGLGCGRAPSSRFPDASAALERVRALQSCSRGIQADATLDYFDQNGRVRGHLSLLASLPDRIRLDAYSPFGVNLSTLTSAEGRFGLYELGPRTYYEGPARACNMARLTGVALPPAVVVQLMRGDAPVLVHQPRSTSIEWVSSWLADGAYRLTVPGQFESVERITMALHPDDFERPFNEQRLRVTEVELEQQGIPVFRVLLDGHRPAEMAAPRRDSEGLASPIMPSGPRCTAELPRRIRILVADGERDVVLAYRQVVHNPPLLAGVFSQVAPGGVVVRRTTCVDR